MSHIDDGKLNALLDGELETAEAEAVRAHIAGCAECATRLGEAKQFLAGAAGLLGALDLPATVNAPAAPVRRVSKTAREVAIDIDGATHKSPAIRPNLPEPATPHSWRFDFSTLSWAAMIVLALGVGYLADEVRHTRGTATSPAQEGEGRAAAPSTAPAAPPAQGTRPSRTATRSGVPTRTASESGLTRPAHAAPRTPSLAPRPSKPAAGKRLAASSQPAVRRQSPRPAPSHALAAAAGSGARAQDGAPARAAPQPAAAPPAADRAAAAKVARPGVAGVVAPTEAAATFRRATLEQAVARLNGIIRLMDGMRFEQVQIGPGRLVPGADRDHDLVRLVYFDAAGRRLQLDQQRVAPRAGGGVVSSGLGMRPGDTLMTASPGGEARVRWIEGTIWLSLSGSLPPDDLRRLIERVR